MNRLILVLQYPTTMRYQEIWFEEFPKQLSKKFEVITLGKDYDFSICKSNPEMFSPIEEAIFFEQYQINEYMDLELKKDDFLLLNDISFPGLFTNILYHKKPKKCYSICHATSKNNLDYFEKDKDSKWLVETGHSKLFDKIFVATQYHKKKLNWGTIVTALPKHNYKRYTDEEKKYNIVNVSRPTPQKVDLNLESIIEKEFKTKIERQSFLDWDSYYKFLSKSKCLFISAQEETFGYQVLDATYNNCITIAPRKFSYPELLPDEYLYSSKEEAIIKVRKVLEGNLSVPEIVCQKQIDNFYENIINEMRN